MSGHAPVMVSEVMTFLQPSRGGLFLDCTVGLGGHAAALLEAGAGGVLGLDRDPAALAEASRRLAPFGDRVTLVHADYRDFEEVLASRGVTEVAGVLADLGVSSMQLDTPERGFSFRADGPLDMRMDPTCGETAAEVVARASERELADLIFALGEERHSRRVARAIVAAREAAPILTTGQLAAVVRRAVPH
ncbi:MAG: 16S rRNA (cytosine(1402)-N(4))-methyltransferase RsmH, partial [Vicinamibacterales bacterium]|nr:16S rRNA (cytosine(1402)-N(4))-methyltransferase RsmH [Vicinamibacterales bacterium]